MILTVHPIASLVNRMNSPQSGRDSPQSHAQLPSKQWGLLTKWTIALLTKLGDSSQRLTTIAVCPLGEHPHDRA
jgi:hypothetical protein